MTWSGSGTFSRATGATGWADDEAASIGITSVRHDLQENELVTGINACLAKNGENAATANLPMGGFLHTNVGDATARTNYGKVSQIQDGAYIWGGTSGGAANAQTLTLSPAITAYAAGQVFRFIAGYTNTAAATLNVNAVGAKNIYTQFGAACVGNEIYAGGIFEVVYDGTRFWLSKTYDQFQPHEVVAATGSATGDAAVLSSTARSHRITGGDGTKGVRLGAVNVIGETHIIFNYAALGVKVYPTTGGNFYGKASNASFTLATAAMAICQVSTGGEWLASVAAALP